MSARSILVDEGHCWIVRGLVWARDGATVATSADGGRVRLLDTGDPPSVRELAGERGEVRRVAFGPDGRRLCAVTSSTIEVADVATGAITARFASFGPHIHSVEFTGEGRHLVAGSYSHGTRVIDLETGAHVASERAETTHASHLVLAGDCMFTMAHKRLTVGWVRLDLRGRVLARGAWGFEEADSSIELCADGSAAMVAWHTRARHRLCTIHLRDAHLPGRVVPIPAGTKLVDVRNGRVLFLEADGLVCCDPATGAVLWRIHCRRQPSRASLSHRGDAVAVAYRDRSVEVFRLLS